MPIWLTVTVTVVSVLGAVVTALATLLLWRVTKVLAVETRRMADASSQPHVVATIEPNRWSMIHADLRVENTGNATAYDIEVGFDPPLQNGEARSEKPLPLQRLSVLKPGHGIASYLTEFEPIIDQKYTVSVTWKRSRDASTREANSYELDLSALKGISRLGASDPGVQLAEQMKKMREDWQYIASGFKKVKVDVYTAADRLHEQRALERRWRRERRQQANPKPE